MEQKTRRCMQCGTQVVYTSSFICGKCEFNNEPWFTGGLPVWILALTSTAAYDCAELNNLAPDEGVRRWYYLDGAFRLAGLKRAVIWRFDDYYRRNDLLAIEACITARRFTYVEAPLQPPIVQKRK